MGEGAASATHNAVEAWQKTTRSFFSAHQKARGVLRPSERGDYVTPFIVCYETALRVLQPRVEPADRDMVCAAVAGFLCRV